MKSKQKIKITLIILGVLIVGGLAVAMVRFSLPLTPEELNYKFITSNPLDLSQVAGFSKYRSCAGHDFRGPVVITGKLEATPRSMKHYVKVLSELRGQNSIVKVFAPFDGKIFEIDNDSGSPEDQQIWLTPDSISPRQWQFIFFHIDLDDNLKKGSTIQAGQLIGTANLMRGPDKATDNFDIAVKFTRPLKVPAIDGPFSHMTKKVLDEYAKYGITENNVVIPEEERDANPCPIVAGQEGPDVYFPSQWSVNDIIWLKP